MQHAARKTYVALLVLAAAFLFLCAGSAHAASDATAPSDSNGVSSMAISVPMSDPDASYGDLISYDPTTGVFERSQKADDPNVFGVAVQDPPIVLLTDSPTVIPIARSGNVSVKVSLENGAIHAGDEIVASSLPGLGMRADSSDTHIIGVARDSFTGQGATTTMQLEGKSVAVGMITVSIGDFAGSALGSNGGEGALSAASLENCTGNPTVCSIEAKINAASLVALVRYVLAGLIVLGALYLAYRSFMGSAVNGVISIGRNPRAKSSIQAMVILNALLAGFVVIVGAGLSIAIIVL